MNKLKLSKHFSKIELNNGVFAVYNSILMDVIFIDKKKLEKILNFQVDLNDLEEYKKLGIYISEDNQDDEAIEIVKKRYDSFSGKLQIMYLIMSSSCNLACKYCFIENCSFNNNIEINMSYETALNAVEKFNKYVLENHIENPLILLYGGEPMVNWKVLYDIVKYTKNLNSNIKFSIVTNATLLDVEKINFLAENEVEIGISIDGPKEINDENRIYRGNDDSVYEKVISKFPDLKFAEAKFGLSLTISNDLLKKQDEVLEWINSLGITSIFYNLYHYTDSNPDWEKYYLEASQFLIKSYDYLSEKNIYDGRLSRKLDSIIDGEFKFSDCAAIGGNQITIKPNGEICVCHGYFKTDKYVIGNINHDKLYDIMMSDEIKFWQERATIYNEECLKCEALFTCGGGCVLQAESLFGSRDEIDRPFCIHTKTSLKWTLQKCYDSMVVDNKKERVIV